MTERQEIEHAIKTLEAQRTTLGDEVVDVSLAVLRQRLMAVEALDAFGPALKGERKQVTVMFADISGFIAMTETLDPADGRSTINACMDRASSRLK
ncbi:MAG: hypothetical protein JSV03_01990 [Planctomycetota bacterium]|nr:MAG: hypothetical protein JSV03_01990 [Planctomycetota bacterium]